jgi:hypothetical protein
VVELGLFALGHEAPVPTRLQRYSFNGRWRTSDGVDGEWVSQMGARQPRDVRRY